MSRPEAARGPIPLDPVATVRTRPEWYFREGVFRASEMASLLADEALSHGSADFAIASHGGWWIATSTSDWLGHDVRAFHTPMPDPERGPNSSRVEVLLTAFCSRVVTAGDGHVLDVVGDGAIPTSVRGFLEDRRWRRVVAFLPVPATRTSHDTSAPAAELVLVTEQNLSHLLDSAIENWPEKARRMRAGTP